MAQEAATPAPDTGATATGGEIVVTGTLIRDPSTISATPIQVTGRAEIQLRQSNTAEDLLRDLPGVVPSIGNAVNNGNAGFSFADLRGLGPNRNLVLLDGQRIAPADLIGRVDLNNIPLALIQRVENLTGGASTTYGADAISGVINFITRSDFSGVEISASDQLTGQGDGNYFRVDGTIGGNFADGKGNVVVSLGYQSAQPIYQGDRNYSITALDSFSGAPAGSSFSNPAVFTLLGNTGGRVQVQPSTGTFATGLYQPFNFNPYNVFQLPFKRYNAYAAGHYEIADDIEVYMRGLYSKNVTQTIVAPSGVAGSNVVIPLSNPYLTGAERSVFCADAGYTTAECSAAATATSPSSPAYRTVTEELRYRSVDAGPRVDRYETQTFDYRGGFRGKITDHISFDVAGSYGESTNDHYEQGYYSVSRVRDALLATNTSTCLSGNTGCVPINLFGGTGSVTSAMNGYVTVPAFSVVRSSLAQGSALINGDVGFASPLAHTPIKFAVGADYRDYQASQAGDIEKTTPGELGLDSTLTPFSGGYNVTEGFGELVAALIEDKPFFQNLTLETGVRYSHYRVDAPSHPTSNTTTYKAGGDWTPVEGVKFRGVYQHAVRAPNIYELFQPASPGLTNLSSDPCSGSKPVGNATLTAVCLAQGAPASSIGKISDPASGQPNTTTAGNLALKPEKSDSFTLGMVLQPRQFIRGFSLTVDYFHIKVTQAITSLSPLDAISACFGSVTAASATSSSCTAIRRNPSTGALDGDPATTGGLYLPLTNQGTLLTDGIDLGANYKHDLGPGTLNLSFQGTWTRRALFKATPTALNRECVGFYSTNCGGAGAPEKGSLQPKYTWNQRTTYTIGNVDLSLLWRHISSMKQEPDDALNGDGPALPAFAKIKAFNYFDASVRFAASSHFTFLVTVQNLANKLPPIVGYDIGSTFFNSGNTYPSTYDTLGRRFGVSGQFSF
ncbi:TonB-dependent receptor domain-containing protein [Sphingomonas nostoxanthinifaciens]|uniref:TonB-dependent receptor domain-containing protein n=1 Tax=Sphingomonas nostoxanthinifaciens TaxID=2872652 RepID=UPI001CC1CAA4|nr:TonB-dependent receptor [Sphingomonas nostoxanthinifaciens]